MSSKLGVIASLEHVAVRFQMEHLLEPSHINDHRLHIFVQRRRSETKHKPFHKVQMWDKRDGLEKRRADHLVCPGRTTKSGVAERRRIAESPYELKQLSRDVGKRADSLLLFLSYGDIERRFGLHAFPLSPGSHLGDVVPTILRQILGKGEGEQEANFCELCRIYRKIKREFENPSGSYAV